MVQRIVLQVATRCGNVHVFNCDASRKLSDLDSVLATIDNFPLNTSFRYLVCDFGNHKREVSSWSGMQPLRPDDRIEEAWLKHMSSGNKLSLYAFAQEASSVVADWMSTSLPPLRRPGDDRVQHVKRSDSSSVLTALKLSSSDVVAHVQSILHFPNILSSHVLDAFADIIRNPRSAVDWATDPIVGPLLSGIFNEISSDNVRVVWESASPDTP
ncbi:putative mitochondrial protein [Andalucia godoyi]|uniref:Putative mitochondrial protein n=1 Tax=Andalucia godoyi TaxID=505711 RepID=A0A8K0F2B5_ANDGO|nr:putative mitochondrial protein [Andalucia godoyi]|eukprot:ANDGO_06624.mRNA.1 putative mitochondrial protein